MQSNLRLNHEKGIEVNAIYILVEQIDLKKLSMFTIVLSLGNIAFFTA